MNALTFTRQQPLVGAGGDAAEYQVSDAFNARWNGRLSDGTWAVVTQTFYLADFEGRRFVESQVEYLWCRDPSDPGSTELSSDVQYIDHTADVSDHPRLLCEQAVDTVAAEWEQYRPGGAPAA